MTEGWRRTGSSSSERAFAASQPARCAIRRILCKARGDRLDLETAQVGTRREVSRAADADRALRRSSAGDGAADRSETQAARRCAARVPHLLRDGSPEHARSPRSRAGRGPRYRVSGDGRPAAGGPAARSGIRHPRQPAGPVPGNLFCVAFRAKAPLPPHAGRSRLDRSREWVWPAFSAAADRSAFKKLCDLAQSKRCGPTAGCRPPRAPIGRLAAAADPVR